MEGYINLHRSLLDSEIFASKIGLKIWIWLLLKATYKQRFVSITIGKGESTVKLERGEILFGRFTAEEALNIDGSTIYKWLKQMEEIDMITIKSNSHYSIITINKYNEYNKIESDESSNHSTTIQQPNDNHSTTIQQPRNTNKKDKKDKQVKKEFIAPTFDEILIYSKERKAEHIAKKFYDYFTTGDWKDSKGNPVKNWKQKFITWETLQTTQNNNGSPQNLKILN
jgi:hypothetical protein